MAIRGGACLLADCHEQREKNLCPRMWRKDGLDYLFNTRVYFCKHTHTHTHTRPLSGSVMQKIVCLHLN